MRVTLGLGLQYLWVDAYRIKQNDDSDFQQQIRQMHLIYRFARVTIIAAGNSDAASGILGISKPREAVQVRGKHGDLDLLTFQILPWDSVLISEGRVNRAWTYQEGYFFRRRIFFAGDQVLFECDYDIVSEDLPLSCTRYDEELAKAQFSPNGRIIYDLIARYTKRRLSHESDILHAFGGIAADLEQRHWTKWHWGIPIVPKAWSYFEGFLVGLCWYNRIWREGSRRRKGFPSWSWAGWHHDCGMAYHVQLNQETMSDGKSQVAIFLEQDDGTKVDWSTIETNLNPSKMALIYAPRVYITAPSLRLKLRKRTFNLFDISLNVKREPHRGFAAEVVGSEDVGCAVYEASLDCAFERLELSDAGPENAEIRTGHALCLFSGNNLTEANVRADSGTRHFALLLVTISGTAWERMGLWTPAFSEQDHNKSIVFEEWISGAADYDRREFCIA